MTDFYLVPTTQQGKDFGIMYKSEKNSRISETVTCV